MPVCAALVHAVLISQPAPSFRWEILNESNSVWGMVPYPIGTNSSKAVFIGNYTTLNGSVRSFLGLHLRAFTFRGCPNFR